MFSARSSASTASRSLSETVSLDDLLSTLLEEMPDVSVRGAEFVRGSTVFAARPSDATIELRLGPEIGEAALNTPDTMASSRGDEWVLLAPRDWLESGDRLEAWFRVAWRLAGKRR